MSLDIKYRPKTYDDVLGQEATITILRRIVAEGKGFQQSYLFCGAHGSGKTTLGRIMARALLCDSPVEGNPCDQCPSCRSLLDNGTSVDFIEVDAATNSGKADVAKIVEDIQYNSFTGKRRLYLFDEAHQLSRDALDALLKPLEDNIEGSDDKQLVCVFCTTEPEKMRATVLSRCAPAFVIRPQVPSVIGERLAYICEQEGIAADREMLDLIAEITECHIRDALKAVEGVSMLGDLNKENVTKYLHLDLNTAYIDLVDAIGSDLPKALAAADAIMQRASPQTCYEKLANICMLAFRSSLGEPIPAYWHKDRLKNVGAVKGALLLAYGARFANRPGRPTAAMLHLDIAHLHHTGGAVASPQVVLSVPAGAAGSIPAAAAPSVPTKPSVEEVQVDYGNVPPQDVAWLKAAQGPAALRKKTPQAPVKKSTEAPRTAKMDPSTFGDLLGRTLMELSRG
jgi:DNA polymerase III subunit gamma/tau